MNRPASASRDLTEPGLSAAALRAALGLLPHPEGGAYRETWRDPGLPRGAGTAILFLLDAGEASAWHRVDAAELWIWQAGGPLILDIAEAGHDKVEHRLGPLLGAEERLHAVVPARAWQSARPVAGWTLVTCVVAPAFRFEGFELAPPDFKP